MSWRVLLRPICLLFGHPEGGSYEMLPEHGYGLYRYAAVHCVRCDAVTTIGDQRPIGSCGECPDGECDNCEMCRDEMPGSWTA